jgi:deoxyribodipyrimidine photo-lyase
MYGAFKGSQTNTKINFRSQQLFTRKKMMTPVTLFWFRRDLRLTDNRGLFHALQSSTPVLPVFIFDKHILDALNHSDDPRVSFIHAEVQAIRATLQSKGSDMWIHYGTPVEVFAKIMESYTVSAVFANEDYEPYARERDATVAQLLKSKGVEFNLFKDHVIFSWDEILKKDGTPYTVFSPYARKWMERLDADSDALKDYPCQDLAENFLSTSPFPELPLETMGFQPSLMHFPDRVVPQKIIQDYDKTRNFPGIRGTSQLGIHFRFGTISIREKARKAKPLNQVYLNELIWRDFYSMILGNFPHVTQRAFRAAYDAIPWRDAPDEFDRWCKGKTGYPIVDAGMRELLATGYMHNRVRMITASFLTKHLLIDWRLGEAWFAEKLLDFDLASNNGGWQWAMGGGTDAAPYFRIFNPSAQQEKFDPELKYVKRWVPEYGTSAYPKPMVDHKVARERCLEVYKDALSQSS